MRKEVIDALTKLVRAEIDLVNAIGPVWIAVGVIGITALVLRNKRGDRYISHLERENAELKKRLEGVSDTRTP